MGVPLVINVAVVINVAIRDNENTSNNSVIVDGVAIPELI